MADLGTQDFRLIVTFFFLMVPRMERQGLVHAGQALTLIS
jgi:hypothetical protein